MSDNSGKLKVVKRGEVYWVDLDPVKGSEQAKTRPCVVLSTGEVNAHRKTVIVIPLTTTKTAAVPPLLVAVPSAGVDSKARVEQIRAVDKGRLKNLLGLLHDGDMREIEIALQRILRIRPA